MGFLDIMGTDDTSQDSSSDQPTKTSQLSTETFDNVSVTDNINLSSESTDFYGVNLPEKKVVGTIHVNNRLLCITEVQNKYFVRLPSWIDPSCYKEYYSLFRLLEVATEKDKIYISVSNIGGSVDLGTQLIGYMKNCKAHITTEVDAHAYSMGAYIWSYGDKLVFKYGSLMFHTISFGIFGKVNMIKKRAGVTDKYARTHLNIVMNKGLLTEDEVNLCIENGKDLYLSASTMQPRIEQYNAIDHYAARLAKIGGR